MEWDLEMAGKYLDGDAVLKALNDLDVGRDNQNAVYELQDKIKRGEFDATVPGRLETIGMAVAYGSDQERMVSEKIVATKDAEIARLNEKLKTKSQLTIDLCHRNKDLMKEKSDLEKLCDMQKATIETQGKTLRVDNLTTSLKIISEDHCDRLDIHAGQISELQTGLKHLNEVLSVTGGFGSDWLFNIETALKALQEEVSGIKKNPILSTYDPTPHMFTTTIPNQYTQTGSYNPPCTHENCKLYAEYQKISLVN